MGYQLQILPDILLTQFKACVPGNVAQQFQQLKESELSIDSFSFYLSVSAVFSSKIEGEKIELDSFIKHKRFGIKYQPDYTRKIDDLYDAYSFAQTATLSKVNINKAHQLLTQHILHKQEQGKIRASNMFVITKDGKIEYVAASPDIVKTEMEKLYQDIAYLLRQSLDFVTALFYAGMIHLLFLKIHPFADGNGRTARLLEKWFLAHKLGAQAWFVQTEEFYYNQHDTCYNHIRRIGLEYGDLDYGKALPFLQLLPQAILFSSE